MLGARQYVCKLEANACFVPYSQLRVFLACANPPDPDHMTAPSELHHPTAVTASTTIVQLTQAIRNNAFGMSMQDAFERAEFAVACARRDGATVEEIARLEEKIRSLKGEAYHDLRQALPPKSFLGRVTAAAQANVETMIKALSSTGHWASKDAQANLVAMIERNGRIPDEYKAQLPTDVAAVLRACPQAGGLVTELTMRGQRGATGSSSKLGSKSNAGVGAAYELMGTAALTTRLSQPVNVGAQPLYIQSGKDIVTFGDKTYLNRRSEDGVKWQAPTRRTIECDVRLGRLLIPDGIREIGVDFKHTKEMGQRNASADLKNQVENVVEAIKHGQIHEYHFVTNGSFGPGFREIINMANSELSRRGESAIGMHEYVTTLATDPTAGTGP
jgi:hypothetical protein